MNKSELFNRVPEVVAATANRNVAMFKTMLTQPPTLRKRTARLPGKRKQSASAKTRGLAVWKHAVCPRAGN